MIDTHTHTHSLVYINVYNKREKSIGMGEEQNYQSSDTLLLENDVNKVAKDAASIGKNMPHYRALDC